MKKLYKLGVVGCGFMARAILKGVVGSDFIRAKKVVVSDPSDEALDWAIDLGIVGTQNNAFLVENSEYVLLAVKPQNFADVCRELEGVYPDKVISIMAGVTRDKIKSAFGRNAKVARCMPNLPCSIGSGMMGVDMSDFNDDQDDLEFINGVLGCLGTVLSTDERKMDAVTAISGSGPAYVFMFIDALTEAGVNLGLTHDEASLLAVQTVMGSAEMVMRLFPRRS